MSSSPGAAASIQSELPAASELIKQLSDAQRTAMLEALVAHESNAAGEGGGGGGGGGGVSPGDAACPTDRLEGLVFAARGGKTKRMTTEEVNALWKQADIDKSGVLSRSEFNILLGRVFDRAQRRGPGLEAAMMRAAGKGDVVIDNKVLFAIFTAQCIPFIGFGFMDNALMITAGEYIELKVGATFALSTMAAAGLGNLLSDIAGVGFSSKIELMAERWGFKNPELTAAQAAKSGPRLMRMLGAVIGISIGCLLGMFPLLFFEDDDEEKEKDYIKKIKALEARLEEMEKIAAVDGGSVD